MRVEGVEWGVKGAGAGGKGVGIERRTLGRIVFAYFNEAPAAAAARPEPRVM